MVPVVLAVFVASRVLRVDDFSIEGSFALGGAWGALLNQLGVSLWGTLLLVLIGGVCVGQLTTFLSSALKIDRLLSGIVVTTALFSCNLKLVGAQAVLRETFFESVLPVSLPWWLFCTVLGLVLVASIWFLLRTEMGLCLRAVGENEHFLVHLGKRAVVYRGIGLALATMLAAFGGFVWVERAGYFSLTGSVGVLMSGIAALIIGRAICGGSVWGVIIGAVVYQSIIVSVVALHIDPAWTRLATAVFVVLWLAFERLQRVEKRRIS